MRILHVGIFSVPSSTTIQMARAIKKKGHIVHCFDFRYKEKTKEFNRFYKAFLNIIEKIKLPFFERIINFHRYYLLGNWKINRKLLYEVKNNEYDIVFFSKADNINYKIISKINKYSKTWYFFMDYFLTAFRRNAQKYAKLSTWSNASYSTVNALFKKEGANSYHITEGFNPRIFNPGKVNRKMDINIIFVGTNVPKRKKYIEFLRRNNIKVSCFGDGWENEPIYINNLADKYRSSKIILNLNQSKFGFSDRVFHALASRRLLISEYCNDLGKFFKKGIHLEWFKSPEELLELVQFYLKNDSIRERIANQGYKYVIENFTWEKIIEKIFQIINRTE